MSAAYKGQIRHHLVAGVVAQAQFQLIGAGLALDAAYPDSVLAVLGQGGAADVHGHVRGDVVGGVMDLIQELLLTGLLRDEAAAVRCLGDVEIVLRQLRDGEP